jgi:hypothetical protein
LLLVNSRNGPSRRSIGGAVSVTWE